MCTPIAVRATALYTTREISRMLVSSSAYVTTNSVTELAFMRFASMRHVLSIGSSFNATCSEEVFIHGTAISVLQQARGKHDRPARHDNEPQHRFGFGQADWF